MAVNHPDGSSNLPWDVCGRGRMVNAVDCKSMLMHCRFESYRSQKKGRSIIGNVFDLGSKDCGFEPHRPDLFGYSLVVE